MPDTVALARQKLLDGGYTCFVLLGQEEYCSYKGSALKLSVYENCKEKARNQNNGQLPCEGGKRFD